MSTKEEERSGPTSIIKHEINDSKVLFSFDIEADGPSHNFNSMRSIGISVFNIYRTKEEKELPAPSKTSLVQPTFLYNISIGDLKSVPVYSYQPIETFYVHIQPQQSSVIDPETYQFWMSTEQNMQQWFSLQHGALTPQEAMFLLAQFYSKYTSQYTSVLWMAKPSSFDWRFLYHYYDKYGPIGKPPLRSSADICLKERQRSFFFEHNVLDKCVQREYEHQLSGNLPYLHNALFDSIYQGNVYENISRIQRHAALSLLNEKSATLDDHSTKM